jgi:hypothetical protein
VEAASLPAACSIAIATVFAVLALLALGIRLITLALPAPALRTDAAVIAAIAASVALCHAGARILDIVEEP